MLVTPGQLEARLQRGATATQGQESAKPLLWSQGVAEAALES